MYPVNSHGNVSNENFASLCLYSMRVIFCRSFGSIIYEVPSKYLISPVLLFVCLQGMCVQTALMLWVNNIILYCLTSEGQQGKRWCLAWGDSPVGREVLPLLGSPCRGSWVLEEVNTQGFILGKHCREITGG